MLIGVAYIHQHDIIHRDLKPGQSLPLSSSTCVSFVKIIHNIESSPLDLLEIDNILLEGQDIKIADFGLSLPFCEERRPNTPEVHIAIV